MIARTATPRTTPRQQPAWPDRLHGHEEEQPRQTSARGRAEKRHFIADLPPQARRHRFMAW